MLAQSPDEIVRPRPRIGQQAALEACARVVEVAAAPVQEPLVERVHAALVGLALPAPALGRAEERPDGLARRGAEIIEVVEALAIQTLRLASAETGDAYSETVQAAGGQAPYSWAISAGQLPAGLALSQSTTDAVAVEGTPKSAADDGVEPAVQPLERLLR